MLPYWQQRHLLMYNMLQVRKKKFADTTKSALDTAAALRSKNDLLFEYLDTIYHDTYYMGQHFGSIIYREDEHINVIQ